MEMFLAPYPFLPMAIFNPSRGQTTVRRTLQGVAGGDEEPWPREGARQGDGLPPKGERRA